MGNAAEIISGIISGGASLAKTGYDIWTNQRDFDYQKSLQQEIFNREDTAVQRRMADLKAAGLNPNLAAGSAAGAGAVVGRSNTPSINGGSLGAALDAASHVQQLRMQRTQSEILKNERDKSRADAEMAIWNKMLNNYQVFQMLGLKPKIRYNLNTGDYDIHTSANGIESWNALDQLLFYQLQNNKNSADMLQKDNNFYYADKIADYVGQAARDAAQFSSMYKNFNYQAPNYQTYNNSQNYYANPYIKNKW